MSAQEDLLARISEFRSKATAKADEFAVRASIILTRLVFLGVLLIPLCQPNTFYIIRAGHLISPPEAELHARIEAPSVASALPPGASVAVDGVPSDRTADAKPDEKSTDAAAPNLPASDGPKQYLPALPAENDRTAKPVPPAKQNAPPWTEAEVAAAKQECDQLLGKITVASEALPPQREGICGAPAPRELRSVGEAKVKFEPPATINCRMIAGLNSWILDKVQPAAQKNFGSPVVRVVAESYSCRNRYGLARAPISEHALMNAVDVSAFVLEDGKIIRVSRNWGPTAEELRRAQKSSQAAPTEEKPKIQLAASKLGAHDLAKKSDDKDKEKTGELPKPEEKQKPKSAEELKEEQTKQAMSAFLHQAHDGACDIFGTVLGPDTNEAHHDHFHLDMKERTSHRALCQ